MRRTWPEMVMAVVRRRETREERFVCADSRWD